MKQRNIKRLSVAICLAAGISASVSANIQQQVNSMFNSMINVTAPGAYQTATSGVITGGNIKVRNRISTVNIAHYTPPSAKGGCGGINMYMGSFSFINAEEFIGLLRNIASNAAGVASAFAFEMAIEAMDSMTGGVLSRLSDKMQAMNQALLNSCQIGGGFVSDTVAAYREKRDLQAAFRGATENVTTDFFSSKRATGESPAQRIAESGVAKQCADVGNILWCGMQKAGFINQFMHGSQENAEFMMSMVGSYLVSYGTDDKGGKNFVATPIRPLEGVNLEVFVGGTEEPLTLYECDTDCLNPSTRTVTGIQGLSAKLMKSVRDSNLFERIKSGETISPAEMNAYAWLFASNLGGLVYQTIHLAGPEAAYSYLNKHVDLIALTAAADIIKTKLDTVIGGVRELEMSDSTKMEEEIRQRRSLLLAEVDTLIQSKYQTLDPLAEFVNYRDVSRQRDQGQISLGTKTNSGN